MKKFVLGLAGFIGSGKSTAAEYFGELGATVIDADKVVNELYKPGNQGYKKIYHFFGEEFFNKDKVLNNRKLAREVFSDPSKLRILHTLIHPLVTTEIQKFIDKSDQRFFVLEATYFEKKHLQKLISALVWVDTQKPLLFQRITESRGMDRSLFEKILRFQFKPEKIDYVLDNNDSKDELKKQVKELWERLKSAIV